MFQNIKQYISLKTAIFFFSFIAGWPCVLYLMGWLPHYQTNYIVLLFFCFTYVLFHRLDSIPIAVKKILFFQILGWIFYSAIHFDTSYFTRILLLVITFFILKMENDDGYSNDFIKIYNGWILLQSICGFIGILLVLSGLLHPIFTFREMDFRMGYYFGLFTTNTYLGGLVRNAGFFDEPGALAFWGIYALLFNKLFIQNKKIEILLLVGLVSTLSVAYFIQVSFYILVFYRKQGWKVLLFVGIIYAAMKFISSYNDEMNTAIFGRLEYDDTTGSFRGDNRSELFARCWQIFCDYPIIGVGAQALLSHEIAVVYGGFVGANFFFNWAADGLLGVAITYLPLFAIWQLGRIDKVYYGIAIILLVGFLQRPYDSTQLLYPLLTYTLFLHGYNKLHKRIGDN